MQDPNSLFPYAESVSTFGTNVALQGADGFGLVSRGLLWGVYNIWFDLDANDGLSTTWTSSNSNITTTWTACTGGLYGQAPP